jgi:outer membrane protein assembly factor BamB
MVTLRREIAGAQRNIERYGLAVLGYRKMRVILLTSALLTAAHALAAEDWPQFRGPTGQGVSTEVELPLEWSESQNVRWKTPVPGIGWSSPVVAGDRVWLTSAVVDRGSTSLRALAFDSATGRQLVDAEVFRMPRRNPLNPKNSHASPTPIVEGDRVYVHFGADGTAALTSSGEVVWRNGSPTSRSTATAGRRPCIRTC